MLEHSMFMSSRLYKSDWAEWILLFQEEVYLKILTSLNNFSTNKLTYAAAKARCIAGNATFPLINSEEELEYYTDEISSSAQWIQGKG